MNDSKTPHDRQPPVVCEGLGTENVYDQRRQTVRTGNASVRSYKQYPETPRPSAAEITNVFTLKRLTQPSLPPLFVY